MPAGYTSGNVSILDTITRTYRNSANDIIATQIITVQCYTVCTANGAGASLYTEKSLSTDRFKRTAQIRLSTTRSPKSGASGIITSITTEGKFNTRSESGGDIDSVTYTAEEPVNALTIPVRQLTGVFTIGDSV